MKRYSDEDLKAIAIEIIDWLRPKHLRITDIRKVLNHISDLLEFVVVREKQED